MRDAINTMIQANSVHIRKMRKKWKKHVQNGMYVHDSFELALSAKGYNFVFLYQDRARLRNARIERIKKRVNGRVFILFPSWAVELLQHPECSKRMLTGAKRNLDYRAEKLMEVRWEERETQWPEMATEEWKP